MTAARVTLADLERLGYGKVEESCLSETDRQLFLRRKKAVELKLSGNHLKAITKSTGLRGAEVCRLFGRYTQIGQDGRYEGERALIPNKRIVPYSRKNLEFIKRTEQRGGLSGMLGLTLRKHPAVLDRFIDIALQKHTDAYRGVTYKKSYYYVEFLNLLREEGGARL